MIEHSRLELLKALPYDMQIEIVENEFRKDWTQSEKAHIAEILKAQLEKQKTPGARTDLIHRLTSDKHLSEVPDSRINRQIGKVFGESYETIRKREKVFQSIDDDTRKALDAGKKSLNSVYRNITSKESLPAVRIPKGQWNVLEIDFPWGYQNQSIGHTGSAGTKTQYPTIPPSQILEQEVPKFQKIIAKDAVIFMWVTTPLLNEIMQLHILESLGFSYKTMIFWHKLIPKEIFGGRGLGYWFAGQMEHCIVGVKGDIRPFRCTLPNFIEAPISRHSEKPVQFKELMEQATKNIPNRKMFEGYQRTPRKGWTGYGNQIKSKAKIQQ